MGRGWGYHFVQLRVCPDHRNDDNDERRGGRRRWALASANCPFSSSPPHGCRWSLSFSGAAWVRWRSLGEGRAGDRRHACTWIEQWGGSGPNTLPALAPASHHFYVRAIVDLIQKTRKRRSTACVFGKRERGHKARQPPHKETKKRTQPLSLGH